MLDTKSLSDFGNQVMRRLFGVEPGWYRQLDIIKNNYTLAARYMALGEYQDAVFRLKFLVWLDAGHKPGWLLLARAYAALGNAPQALRALDKLLALDGRHAEALRLKATLSGGGSSAEIEVSTDMDAQLFYAIHKECFPVYWKEAEIADMLLVSGTQGWLARMNGQPVGMLLMRAQFEQAEILTICVLPQARGRGTARHLIKMAELALAADGVKIVFLEVAENNEAACKLYHGLGYRESNRRREYYQQADNSRVDAIVMSKALGV